MSVTPDGKSTLQALCFLLLLNSLQHMEKKSIISRNPKGIQQIMNKTRKIPLKKKKEKNKKRKKGKKEKKEKPVILKQGTI